ncbi:MAG: dihydropteroate synthase [Flavitalea sp.]
MFTLNCNGKLLMASHPLVMGIINVTPDSFYEASRLPNAHPGKVDTIVRKAEQLLADGADIIDIGAQSTRPHSELVSEEDELKRLDGLFYAMNRYFPDAVFSVDTFYSRVAQVSVSAGASMINDISGGKMDDSMILTAGKLPVPYVCMHSKGTPQTMQQYLNYENLVREILDFFIVKMEECRLAGIKDVIIDPGFGFSKNIDQNFELLKNLEAFKILGRPLMAGLSRKSTVYKTLGLTAEEALNGTTVMNTIALIKGADILRVHDVKEAKECIKLTGKIA